MNNVCIVISTNPLKMFFLIFCALANRTQPAAVGQVSDVIRLSFPLKKILHFSQQQQNYMVTKGKQANPIKLLIKRKQQK